MSDFPPALAHSGIEEIFPDVFFVTGTMKATFTGADFQFSRNMIVVREGTALTLVNTVRLDAEGLAQLDGLGSVKNIVKLGTFHGIDDPYYIDRYGAKLWALPGMSGENGLSVDVVMTADSLPFAGCKLFSFETSKQPEGLLLIEREGGVLIACDSLQNWVEADRFFDEASATTMAGIGFLVPANIGPGWLHACTPQARDFDAVLELDFKHLLPAHGRPIKGDAHSQLAQTFAAFKAG